MLRLVVCIVILWAVIIILATTVHAQNLGYGVTCADVRKLTAVERWYWRKRLHLSDEQIQTIRKICGVK